MRQRVRMNQQKRNANSGIVIMAVTLVILVNLSWPLLAEDLGNTNLPIPSSGEINGRIQYVYGDKIYENGTEVVWRGAGASYLLHAKDYIEAWNRHLPEIQEMGLNTLRLAFRFPDSSTGADGYMSSDTLNYTMLDNVLAWLDLHGLKAILDCHNCLDMYGDFGSQKLINDWVALAGHYRFDPRIAAYELFNEPYWNTRDSSVRSQEDVARAYQTLTNEIRKVDPEHIVIWEAQPHLPVLETISEYFDANMVFTLHKWYDKGNVEFRIWNVTTFSFASIAGMVEMRSKINKPFWLGEFGSYWPWDSSNPEWLLTNETLLRCEEQMLGWNLWMHESTGEKPWDEYLQLFPLESNQSNLTRKPWILPLPNMLDSMISQRHSDIFEPCNIELRHNNDQVTFKGSGLVILVVTSRVLSDGSQETVEEQQFILDKELTIINEENTVNHPGDWKTKIIPIGWNTFRAYNDFDSGNFGGWNGVSLSPGETAIVTEALRHHGTYGALFTSNGTGGTEYAHCYKSFAAKNELYVNAYFYVIKSGIFEEGDRICFMQLYASSTGVNVAYAGWRKVAGVVKWYLAIRDGSNQVYADSATTPVVNTWYCLELHWKKSGVNGLGELWVDEVKACSISGKNTTLYGDVTTARFGLATVYYSGSTSVYCDCVRIATTYIDPEPIAESFSASPNSFSPNGDGSEDTTTITATFNVAVKWNLQIRNSAGAVLRTWTGTGSNLSVVWDGKNSTGFKVSDGTYTVHLSGTDLSGITFTTKSLTVAVDTKSPTVTSVSVYPASFNPRTGETTRINYTLSGNCHVTAKIYNSTGTLKRTLLNYVLQGRGVQSLIWNGKDSGGNTVSPGTYTIKIYAVDEAGNKATPYPIIETMTIV